MRILDELVRHHRLIERVAGSLVTFASRPGASARPAETLERYCTFFEQYADAYHHAMEEDVLLVALREAGLPEKGPIGMIREEHVENRAAVRALRAFGAEGRLEDPGFAEAARRYCARLWEHIDKEDSVLFPEIGTRLALERAKLDAGLEAAEKEASGISGLEALGAELVAGFTPVEELPGVIRGEGCTPCRHYGEGCQGVEREWWSDLEWDEFYRRDH